MDKSAIITGITGQTGSYLAELLLIKGYKVYGIKRRSSTNTDGRIRHLLNDPNFEIIEGDICDPSSIHQVVKSIRPTEFYNLAAQSHVKTSFEQPSYTFQVNAVGALNCLESIRLFSPSTKFLQASTSELWGSSYSERDGRKFQNEDTPFYPRSPYAVAKLAAHHLTINYRESYNLFACCSILQNHESPRRGEEFVTRKITKWIGEFVRWSRNQNCWYTNENYDYIFNITNEKSIEFPKLRLGNINSYRDWGHAKDYCYAQYLMLQQEEAEEFVIGNGEAHSVRDFLAEAFKIIGITNWQDYIVIDPKYYRPAEVEYLQGDASKARKKLGWKPQITFKELVREMVEADIYGKEKEREKRGVKQAVHT